MTLILYGLLMAHLNSYKAYYTNIGITFGVTYLMKRLIKSVSKDHADLIGLGGYSLSIGEFVKLMGAIKQNGTGTVQSEEAQKILGGVLGKGVDLLVDLFKK